MFNKPKIYKCVECGAHDHFMDNSTASDANWNQGLITRRWFCPKCAPRKVPKDAETETIHSRLAYQPPSRDVVVVDWQEMYYKEQRRSAEMKKQRDDFEAVMNYQVTELEEHAKNLATIEKAYKQEQRMRKVAEQKLNEVVHGYSESDAKKINGLSVANRMLRDDNKRLTEAHRLSQAAVKARVDDINDFKDTIDKMRRDYTFMLQDNQRLSGELGQTRELLLDAREDEATAHRECVKAEKECKEWEDTVNLITKEFKQAEQDNAELEKELSGCKAENRGLRETLEIYNVKTRTDFTVEEITESFKNWRMNNLHSVCGSHLVFATSLPPLDDFKDYEFAMGLLRRCEGVEVID